MIFGRCGHVFTPSASATLRFLLYFIIATLSFIYLCVFAVFFDAFGVMACSAPITADCISAAAAGGMHIVLFGQCYDEIRNCKFPRGRAGNSLRELKFHRRLCEGRPFLSGALSL